MINVAATLSQKLKVIGSVKFAVADTKPSIGAKLLFQSIAIVYFCCFQTKDVCSYQHLERSHSPNVRHCKFVLALPTGMVME